MRFTKMHGIGNDYVYINCFDVPLPKDPAGLARKIADRRRRWRRPDFDWPERQRG
jgi:diaminopimelate epimerase